MIYIHGTDNEYFQHLALAIQEGLEPNYPSEIVANTRKIDETGNWCADWKGEWNRPEDLHIFNWMVWCMDRGIQVRVRNYMVYQTEVLWWKLPMNPQYKDFLDSAIEVYDVSQANLKYYPRAKYLPLKYSRAWDRRPWDVLFYGSLNTRRKAIIEGIRKSGLSIYASEGLVSQKELDAIIDKSKMVLSVAYDKEWGNDSARIMPLLSSNIPVLAEATNEPEWDKFLEQYPTVTVAPYDKLVETATKILYKDKFIFPIPEKPWIRSA